nr:DNA-3-methyladenine glycosylase [Acidobacteriota bacterium]
MKKLSREFYTRADTLQIAQDLLGKTLVIPNADGARVSGMIVETEAYLGIEDKAAHSYGNRRTKRTETMFATGGTVYIFFIYGMYFQFNVVVGEKDVPHAVLIRAVEPIENIELMRERRGAMKDT